MTDNHRPLRLPYRAKDGVIDTHVGSIERHKKNSLDNFIGKAINWSRHVFDEYQTISKDKLHELISEEKLHELQEKYCYRLLDSFMTDTITEGDLNRIINNDRGSPVQILLVHPNSEFASIRARVQDKRPGDPRIKAWRYSQQGLIQIASAVGNIHYIEDRDVIQNAINLFQSLKQSMPNGCEIRFYFDSPASPLYFFQDIVLAGRFGTGVSSAELRWEMIVDDPFVEKDLYDALLGEFKLLWEQSSISLENIQESSISKVSQEAKSPPKVFISHSTSDKELARELQGLFQQQGIEAFVAELDIDPGNEWTEEIRQNLFSCQELVFILNQRSLNSHWVSAECGAAWALNKTITPATVGVDFDHPLQFIQKHQSIEISHTQGKNKLIEVICKRLGRISNASS